MAFDPETLRTELARVLRQCEPRLSSQQKQTQDVAAKRRVSLETVRRLLQSWKQDLEGPDEEDDLPETLYYIPALREAGSTSLVDQLAPIVDDLDVTLYRAEVIIHRQGSGKEPDDWECRRNMIRNLGDAGNGNPDEDVGDDEEFEFDAVDEEEFMIGTFITLDGEELDEFDGYLVDEEDIIPKNHIEVLGEPDEAEHVCSEGIYVSFRTSIKLTRSIILPSALSYL
ncbi:hypothetical protein SCHPADRAFT_226398 [Schizopora paradoxa]|uniref:Uncharacterized protein n=1 Tax=Schizopora paradoxa TaxID=27342 RepID=A0A0H2SGM0_9AGAM|nr:hypothetical protein SCHPADRAFT_226398 [Schizopora paradoxa]